MMSTQNDILVIGAGLAGLMAALQLSAHKKKVRLIAKGWGATHWHAGCIDVLGYYPLNNPEVVSSPEEALADFVRENPDHPYAIVGRDRLEAALAALQSVCAQAGYPLQGTLTKNWLLPSAVGTARPTCLAPEMMVAGDLSRKDPMLIVGFKHFNDFYPNVVADNLNKQGVPAQHLTVDLPSLAHRHFTTSVILANMMERADVRAELVTAVKPHAADVERVGFPAVLGIKQALAVKEELAQQLGKPVFEIPGLPPSVPGIRLHRLLKAAIERQGGRVYDGMEAQRAEDADGRITAVFTESAARQRPHRFQRYVLATGGILGGGITTNYKGDVREVVFDLPVNAPESRLDWFQQDFMAADGHPIYRAGLTVNGQFQPVNGGGAPVYENVYAAGTTLAHCEAIRERSFEGIAVATGYAVGQLLAA